MLDALGRADMCSPEDGHRVSTNERARSLTRSQSQSKKITNSSHLVGTCATSITCHLISPVLELEQEFLD